MDAFGVDPVHVMKCGQLAESAFYSISFSPIQVIEKRDVSRLGGSGFWR
jgi:hypothetical protein